MRALALSLLLVLTLHGCAEVKYAISDTPKRVEDSVTDPVRRAHVATEVGLSTSSLIASIGVGMAVGGPLGLLVVGPLVGLAWYFGMYEFVLEPWSKARVEEGKPSLVGPYWERGPQDGESYVHP